jgi:hypothetical protein
MDIRSLHKEGHSIKALARLDRTQPRIVCGVLREAGPSGFKRCKRHSLT